MRSILLQLPELIEDQEIEELLRVGDRNGDGKLDLEDLGYDTCKTLCSTLLTFLTG